MSISSVGGEWDKMKQLGLQAGLGTQSQLSGFSLCYMSLIGNLISTLTGIFKGLDSSLGDPRHLTYYQWILKFLTGSHAEVPHWFLKW